MDAVKKAAEIVLKDKRSATQLAYDASINDVSACVVSTAKAAIEGSPLEEGERYYLLTVAYEVSGQEEIRSVLRGMGVNPLLRKDRLAAAKARGATMY